MRWLRMWEPEPEPARRPAMLVYQAHGAVAWLVSAYVFTAIHALLGRWLPARWLGGALWGFGPNPGGVDASRLALPPSAGAAALLGLISVTVTLLVAGLLWWLSHRVESFLVRLWLAVIAYVSLLGTAISLLADSIAPVPGGDTRMLLAGLGTLWRALNHPWLLAPFALALLLALVALIGQDLVRLAAQLHPPGSDGFGSWALAPIGPGLVLQCLWLGWAGWRLPQRIGLWVESFVWIVALALVSLVAYGWSRRLRRHPPAPPADASGLIWFFGAGLVALIGLLVAFGVGPALDRVWVMGDPPASVLASAGTLAGNLALDVDRNGTVKFTLDLALVAGNDPIAARLAARIQQPDAVPVFWQTNAEALLRLALPGMGWQEIKGTRPLGAMWVAGHPAPAARRFTGTLTTPGANLAVALPADGTLRLDDLAISSTGPVTVIGLDSARKETIKLPLAGGAVYHYSRSIEGSYFLPGADTPPVRLSFFRIQTP